MRRVIASSSKKKVETASMSTRARIANLEDRIADLRDQLADPYLDEDTRADIGMNLAELEDELNFAWQDDEAEYNAAWQAQEFNPDGSLKGYDDDVYSSEKVEGAAWAPERGDFAKKDIQVSQCSFDFINVENPEDTRTQRMSRNIEHAFRDAGVEPIGIDFRSVDYSMYKEYADKVVGQCSVDFEWSGSYSEEAIEEELASELDWMGYELIGISFNSLD